MNGLSRDTGSAQKMFLTIEILQIVVTVSQQFCLFHKHMILIRGFFFISTSINQQLEEVFNNVHHNVPCFSNLFIS